MTSVTVEEAQSRLPELIDALKPGEELVIVRDEQPIAALVGRKPSKNRASQFGRMRGKIHIAEDFDAPLEDFREYME